MLNKQAPTIYGDGEQSRDFTFVSNVVDANLLACTAEGAVGQAVNIACGDRISLLQLVDKLNELLGTEIVPRHEPARPGDVKHSMADISRAREKLGFIPRVDFDEGLSRTLEYMARHAA